MKSRILSIILSVFLSSQICFAQLCAKLVDVSEGEVHILALDNHGNLYSCGGNSDCYDQLGLGDISETVLSLQLVHGPNNVGFLNHIIAFDAGWYHSLAVDSNHFCWAFGYDYSGQLGNGSNEGASSIPILVHGLNNDSNGLRNIVKVSAGRSGQHSLAIRNDGNLVSWGLNNYGQCATEDTNSTNQFPHLVVDSNSQTQGKYLGQEANIVDIEAGECHSIALASITDGGIVYEWGENVGGIPRKVPGENGVGLLRNITDIANLRISLAVDSNHQVWQWSPGGNPTRVTDGQMQTQSGYLENIVRVAAGLSICAAIDSNGNVWEWSIGGEPAKVTDGQMQTQSGYLEDIVALDAGWNDFRVAVDEYGRGWSWGSAASSYGGIGGASATEPVEMLCAELPPTPVVLTKTDDIGDCALPDSLINYEICFDANGYSDSNVILTDYLPDEVDFNSCSDGGDYNSQTKTVTWNIGTMAADDNDCFHLQVKVNSNAIQGQTITNTCELTGDNFSKQATIDTNVCCMDNVVYVDKNANGANNGSSWTNAYTNLQTALTNVRDGNCGCADEIWVKKGLYKPTEANDPSPSNKTFAMISGKNIYGHFDGNETSINQRRMADNNYASILTGDIDDNNTADVQYVVTAANSRIDGFTVRKGVYYGIFCSQSTPTIANCIVKDNNDTYGYGIYCENGANTTIINTFVNNNKNVGINGSGSGTSINIDHCTVGSNNMQYGLYASSCTVNATDSIFSGNKNCGILASYSHLTVERCNITDNCDIGISCSGTDANIQKCLIQRNGSYGLLVQDGSVNAILNIVSNNNYPGMNIGTGNSRLMSNLIYRNNYYGIQINCATTAQIRNNTIAYNTCYGIYKDGGADPNIKNNIIWGNGDDVNDSFYGTFNLVNYNCIQGSFSGGIGNIINIAPCFVDANNDNYHLKMDSNCIDKGDPNFNDANEVDIDGENRIIDGDSNGTATVDIGADEYWPFDMSPDGIVDFFDFAVFAGIWGKSAGQSGYNDRCDFYNDNKIDYKDLEAFCAHWLYISWWNDIGGEGAYFEQMSGEGEGESMQGESMMSMLVEQQDQMMEDEELTPAIYLICDDYTPEPNEEVTVQIYSDAPLFCMGLGITVTGDAEITDAMSTADCNEYGWDPGWPTDPYIDPDEGWLYVSGVRWEGGVEGVVGYFKFRYNSGQVSVSIMEDSAAFDSDCEPVGFSMEALTFESDPNG